MEISLENRDKIIALLQAGICPICGNGKFKNPLQHTRQAHNLDSKELKDLLLCARGKGFASPDLSEKLKVLSIENNSAGKMLEKRLKTQIEKTTDLTKQKYSNTIKEKISSNQEYKQHMLDKAEHARITVPTARRRKVIRISTDGDRKIYNSIKEAAKDNSTGPATICYGLKQGSKSKGYYWIYG